MDEMASLPEELNRLDMSSAMFRVLTDLWRYAPYESDEPFVVRSRDSIQDCTGLKRNTMSRAIGQLLKSGLIRADFGDNGGMSGHGFWLMKEAVHPRFLTRPSGKQGRGRMSRSDDARHSEGRTSRLSDARHDSVTHVTKSGRTSQSVDFEAKSDPQEVGVTHVTARMTHVTPLPSTLMEDCKLIAGGTSAPTQRSLLDSDANDALGESPKTGTPQLKPPPKTNQRLLVEARRHGYTPEKTEKLWARQNELRSQAATRLGIKCRPLTMSATGHGRIIGCLAEPFSYDQLEKCLEHRARSCDKASFRTFWDGVKNWTLASIRRDIDQIDSKGTHVHREAFSRQRNSITVGCANEAGSGRRAKPEIWTSESVDVGTGE